MSSHELGETLSAFNREKKPLTPELFFIGGGGGGGWLQVRCMDGILQLYAIADNNSNNRRSWQNKNIGLEYILIKSIAHCNCKMQAKPDFVFNKQQLISACLHIYFSLT